MTAFDQQIAERWERIARLDGWQGAEDSETCALVVFHEDKAHHYVGADAWKRAACTRTALSAVHTTRTPKENSP